MKDVIKIITLENEVEARAIEQLLKDNKIPFNLKSLRDPAYDGIFQVQKGWGFIEAPKEFKNVILTIYENFKKYKKNHKEVKVTKNSDEISTIMKNIVKIFIGFVLLVAVIYFIKTYIQMKNYINHVSKSKNFVYKWNEKEKIMFTLLRDNRKVISKYFDNNYDQNYEKLEYFNKEQKKIAEHFDDNEDGFYEKTIVYFPDGNLIIYEDFDDDRYFESCTIKYITGETKKINVYEDVFKIKLKK